MRISIWISLGLVLGLASGAPAQPGGLARPPGTNQPATKDAPPPRPLDAAQKDRAGATLKAALEQKTTAKAAGHGGAASAHDDAKVLSPHGDIATLSGNLGALVFWLFALAMVGGALFVVTRRNLVTAVMGMVGTFFGLAAAYMLLFASFVSVLQMLVYAGAIMVLFVFVIMILNRPEDEPVARGYRWGHILSIGGILYLLVRLGSVLVNVHVPTKAGVPVTNFAPAAVPAMEGKVQVAHAFGSTKAVGTELFGHYLFPFEAISIVLLIAVVAAIAIARPLQNEAAERQEGQP